MRSYRIWKMAMHYEFELHSDEQNRQLHNISYAMLIEHVGGVKINDSFLC